MQGKCKNKVFWGFFVATDLKKDLKIPQGYISDSSLKGSIDKVFIH